MADDPPPVPPLPGDAQSRFQEGQWREAFESYKRRALDEQNSGKQLADDFLKAIQSLRKLQQDQQIDEFREDVIEVHADDWRLLQQAAA